MDDKLFSAEQQREIETLRLDLESVAVATYDGKDTITYDAKQLGLFGDRLLPPEIEVMRLLRLMAESKRLMIVKSEDGGKRVIVSLRSGVTLVVERRRDTWPALRFALRKALAKR